MREEDSAQIPIVTRYTGQSHSGGYPGDGYGPLGPTSDWPARPAPSWGRPPGEAFDESSQRQPPAPQPPFFFVLGTARVETSKPVKGFVLSILRLRPSSVRFRQPFQTFSLRTVWGRASRRGGPVFEVAIDRGEVHVWATFGRCIARAIWEKEHVSSADLFMDDRDDGGRIAASKRGSKSERNQV